MMRRPSPPPFRGRPPQNRWIRSPLRFRRRSPMPPRRRSPRRRSRSPVRRRRRSNSSDSSR
jgi:RNA-binding protein with serine-rich domain 1